MKKIDIVNKSYQTKNGDKVILHEYSNDGCYKYYGIVEWGNTFHLCKWDEYGCSNRGDDTTDLVEIPKTVTIAFLKYNNGSLTSLIWEEAEEERKKIWRESPYFIGLSTCTLPVKD